MNLLLDTHTLLWAFGAPDRLGPVTRAALVDPRSYVAVSAATIWEIEVKRALGKLRAPDDMADRCRQRGYDELPIGFGHAEAAGRLPQHHSDPFDRMLIAQAIVDDLHVVTADERFASYDVAVLPAFD